VAPVIPDNREHSSSSQKLKVIPQTRVATKLSVILKTLFTGVAEEYRLMLLGGREMRRYERKRLRSK
jgi:hypothetical protein